MLRKYRDKYAASESSSETSEQTAGSASSKIGSDALKYNAIGSYTIESKDLSEDEFIFEYMYLNITKTDADDFVAFFKISGITGIMLLGTDEEELFFRWLDKRYEGQDKSASEDAGAKEDMKKIDSNHTGANSESLKNENQETQKTHIKTEDRHHPDDKDSSLDTIPLVGLKRERTSSSGSDSDVDAKRQKLLDTTTTATTVTHDALFLMWRGRNSEGEIQLDPQGDFIGHIKFLDAECSQYEGVFYDTYTDLNLTIKGKKVSQDPGTPGENWAELSWRVWEDEGGEHCW